MMASIPNMRSTPLPAAGGKTAPTEVAPGDFASQLPIARGQIVPLVTPRPQSGADGAALVVPDIAAAMETVDGETPDANSETPETPETGETATPDQPQPAEVAIPFLQTPPIAPLPLVQPAVASDEVPATEPKAPVVQAATGKRGRPAGEPGGGKVALTLPAVTDAPEAKTDPTQPEAARVETQLIEAAVKELMQRKQTLAKPIVAAPRGTKAAPVKPEAAPVEARGQIQPQASVPAAPAPIQTSAPVPASAIQIMTEPPQPALAPAALLPLTASAGAPATAEGMRTADLAVERQLDLARDSEWLDRLARDIARAGASDTPLRFRLHPQTLGHLQVELQQGDRGTAVRLTVETEAARQLLTDAQPRLAAEARAQGVRIAETHVDLSGSGRHAPGDQRRQDEARQSPLMRTARGAGPDAAASVRPSRRDRLDRYA